MLSHVTKTEIVNQGNFLGETWNFLELCPPNERPSFLDEMLLINCENKYFLISQILQVFYNESIFMSIMIAILKLFGLNLLIQKIIGTKCILELESSWPRDSAKRAFMRWLLVPDFQHLWLTSP